MDLAESIRENTRAVTALNATLGRLIQQHAWVRDTIDVPATETVSPAAPKTEKAPSVVAEVTLADVKAAAIALAKQDREKLAAALNHFGAAKVVDLQPNQYRDFLGVINA